MKTSQIGIDLIKRWESFKGEAYICPAGILTIGYGRTNGVKENDKITQEQAEEYLKQDLIYFENKVKRNIKIELNQNQFDALVSYFYNIGFSQTMVNLINEKASKERIKIWWENHYIWANGQKLKGLVSRRKDECELFFKL